VNYGDHNFIEITQHVYRACRVVSSRDTTSQVDLASSSADYDDVTHTSRGLGYVIAPSPPLL